MNAKKFSDAMSELDTKYVDEALNYKKKAKKPGWIKWGAMAACLCLVVVCAITSYNTENTFDYPETMIYNNAEYVVCGEGEAAILENCGLPVEISADLAGEHICYLIRAEKDKLVVAENATESQAELFEYAPVPNENIFILCIEGKYYATIRRDSNGYYGLPE